MVHRPGIAPRHRSLGVIVALAAMAACGADDSAVPEVQVPDGFTVSVVAEAFVGPTQISPTGDGRFVVAELNGEEKAGQGQVVVVDLDSPDDRTVLVDGLLTPTGVAVADGQLWIMEQRRLTVGPLNGEGERAVVAEGLPYNGRSEGSLTVVDGGLLYETSGAERDDQLAPGSGTLWRVTGPDAEPEPVATGIKHAYGHVVHPDGRLFVTEITEVPYDGAVPPDELMVVAPGDDFGYPRCVGDRVPVAQFGITAAGCANSPPAHALFPPAATPTSVAVAPWDDDVVLVALWNRGEVVAVPAAGAGRPHEGQPFLTGLENPQHLLADGDRLLVVDHAAGRILAVTPTGAGEP